MKPKLKKLTKAQKAKIESEFKKGFDFSKAQKKGIFINLNESTLTYFKDLALKEGKGYQSLIQDALQYFVKKKLKPKVNWD